MKLSPLILAAACLAMVACHFSAVPPAASELNTTYPELFVDIRGAGSLSLFTRLWSNDTPVTFGASLHHRSDSNGDLKTVYSLEAGALTYSAVLFFDIDQDGAVGDGDRAYTAANISLPSVDSQGRVVALLEISTATMAPTYSVGTSTVNFAANMDYICIFTPGTEKNWSSAAKGNALFFVKTPLADWASTARFTTDGAGNIIASTMRKAWLPAHNSWQGVCVLDANANGTFENETTVSTSNFSTNGTPPFNFTIP